MYFKFSSASADETVLFGRAYKENDFCYLSWSNSAIAFNFTGNKLIISFGEYSSPEPAYIAVAVDSKIQRFALSTGKEKVIIDDLNNSVHRVRITRITEGVLPVLVGNIEIYADSDIRLIKPRNRKKYKLEFLGDSLTAGYGVLADSSIKIYNSYEQDCMKSYAYFTAQALNAEITTICISGQGVVSDCNGGRNGQLISKAFFWKNRQEKLWDFSLYTPDAVILNVGTNDAWGGVSNEEFVPKAIELLKNIRAAYHNAKIIYAYGYCDRFKVPAVQNAVTEFNKIDGNAYFIDIRPMSEFENEVGGNGHPNVKSAKRVAAQLSARVAAILKG